MITDHDPGDEHVDKPWPFYESAAPFEMPASDDLTFLFVGRFDARIVEDGRGKEIPYVTSEWPTPPAKWHTTVAGVDLERGRFAVEHADGRVEDITELMRAVNEKLDARY
jgi:hypothetical protein